MTRRPTFDRADNLTIRSERDGPYLHGHLITNPKAGAWIRTRLEPNRVEIGVGFGSMSMTFDQARQLRDLLANAADL